MYKRQGLREGALGLHVRTSYDIWAARTAMAVAADVAVPDAVVRVACSERWRRRHRPAGRSRAGPRRGSRARHVLVRGGPCGPGGCGGVGRPGELMAGARSVGPGPGVVPGYAEAGKGAGCVRPCHSWLLLCGCGVWCEKKWCEYVSGGVNTFADVAEWCRMCLL